MFFISVIAAIFSTSASIPQLLGKTDKLSYFTMIIRCSGAILWAVYGVIKCEYALIVSSSIASIIEICLIVKTRCTSKETLKPGDNERSQAGVQLNDSCPTGREGHE